MSVILFSGSFRYCRCRSPCRKCVNCADRAQGRPNMRTQPSEAYKGSPFSALLPDHQFSVSLSPTPNSKANSQCSLLSRTLSMKRELAVSPAAIAATAARAQLGTASVERIAPMAPIDICRRKCREMLICV